MLETLRKPSYIPTITKQSWWPNREPGALDGEDKISILYITSENIKYVQFQRCKPRISQKNVKRT